MAKKIITIKEIRDPSNYYVWGGYMETPISFNPLGNQWLGDLYQEGRSPMGVKRWIKENEDMVVEILENSGFNVVESKKKLRNPWLLPPPELKSSIGGLNVAVCNADALATTRLSCMKVATPHGPPIQNPTVSRESLQFTDHPVQSKVPDSVPFTNV